MLETPACCNYGALSPSYFYFLTSECRNPAVHGFWENQRVGRYVVWDKPSRFQRPKHFLLWYLLQVLLFMTCVGVWQNMHVNVSSEPLPLPFVNRYSCFFPSVRKGSFSFSHLAYPLVGVTVFEAFLRSEFSDENLQFYLACEQYRQSSNKFSLHRRAKMISETYIQPGAPREVDLSKFSCLFTV